MHDAALRGSRSKNGTPAFESFPSFSPFLFGLSLSPNYWTQINVGVEILPGISPLVQYPLGTDSPDGCSLEQTICTRVLKQLSRFPKVPVISMWHEIYAPEYNEESQHVHTAQSPSPWT
ncbi:hypothetical protein CLAIMM_11559 [Cladophialophora immunda]|nr:hypothetical protein CLAIMM_11559 [Cladophialophora immunda]